MRPHRGSPALEEAHEEAHEVGIVTAECVTAEGDGLVVLALSTPPSSHGTRRCVRHGVPVMPRVMVVEDDESVVRLLSCLLAGEGFHPVPARTGEAALEVFRRAGAELVLLDLGLPGLAGTEVFRRLRRISDVPVIMVTGKGEEIDRIVGLELGADDYVTKPFSPRELIARVRAVLRRRDQEPEEQEEILISGPVRMDVAGHVVTVRDEPVRLPLKEFEVLEMLLRNAGLVVTRMRLIEAVWGPEYVDMDTKTLDVHIRRLRTKIEPVPREPRHIVTVRGLGYKFEAD